MKKLLALALVAMMILSLVPFASAEELPHVTLKFIFFADKKADTDKVWAAIAEKYKDQLNCDFDVQFIPADDYKQRLLQKAGVGDKWDLNFDAEWQGYFQMITQDFYMDITELLPKYAPSLYAALEKADALGSATYNGKIVSIPWTMMMNNRTNFLWRGDLADAAGITVDKENVKTLEDVMVILEQLKAAYPDRYIIEVSSKEARLDKYSLVHIGNNLVIDLTAEDPKVMLLETTDAYRELAKYAQELQEKGLIWKDILNDKTDHNALINEGKLISKWGTYEYARSGRAWVEEGSRWDYVNLYPDGKVANRSSLSNLVAIPATSENPERALMFLELLETDQEMYDMVHYGILGETYNINDEGAVVYPDGMSIANSSFMGWQGRWPLWKPQFMRPDDEFAKDFWKEEAENALSNPNNVASPYDAFVFNGENVNIELAQRDQVFTDAHKMIEVGLAGDADAAVDKLIADQAVNGEIILKEAQAQLDAFLGK